LGGNDHFGTPGAARSRTELAFEKSRALAPAVNQQVAEFVDGLTDTRWLIGKAVAGVGAQRSTPATDVLNDSRCGSDGAMGISPIGGIRWSQFFMRNIVNVLIRGSNFAFLV